MADKKEKNIMEKAKDLVKGDSKIFIKDKKIKVIALISIYVHGKEVKAGQEVEIYDRQFNSRYFKLKDETQPKPEVKEPKRG